MGHDIYGARSKGVFDQAYVDGQADGERYPYRRPEEFPYLRYSMGNARAHEVYSALNCEDLDGNVSGVGQGRDFTLEQLEAADRNLKMTSGCWEDWIGEQEVPFFEKLIGYAKESGHAYIFFG